MVVLVFDADGTLYVHRNQKDAYLKALGKDMFEVREEYKRVAREIGDPIFMTQRVFFALFEVLEGNAKSPAEAIKGASERRRVFREAILDEIEPSEIARRLPELYRKYPVFVASNDVKDFLLDKLAKVGVMPYVHHVFSAIDFGVLKPHDAFFTRLRAEIEERVGKTRMIFVDDLRENVEAAERNGFEAYMPEEFLKVMEEELLRVFVTMSVIRAAGIGIEWSSRSQNWRPMSLTPL